MAKTKKVSVSTMNKIVKEYNNTMDIEISEGVSATVKKTLTLREVLGFVDAVVESCFQENAGYMPELKEFAILKNIVEKYTNISLPDNLEHQYDILYRSSVVKRILANIDRVQYNGMMESIDQKIKARVTNTAADRDITNIIMKVLEAVLDKTMEAIDNIDTESVRKVLSALGKNDHIDEAAIVRAVLNNKES